MAVTSADITVDRRRGGIPACRHPAFGFHMRARALLMTLRRLQECSALDQGDAWPICPNQRIYKPADVHNDPVPTMG